MRLGELAELAGARPPESGVDVVELAYDSREVRAGSLFFCLRGTHFDGHDFAGSAIRAGAVAVACERPLGLGVPEIVVENSREAMNRVAAPFYGYPSRDLRLVGVTGTKGKTTTCYMLRSVFEAAGVSAGVIGTIQIQFDGATAPGVRTTPQSIDLQRLFRKMVSSGVKLCAMEATSIGIDQGRVAGTEFDVGVFTNLSRDHLDEYHGTMENYYESKRSLFLSHRVDQALINTDDDWGRRMASEIEIRSVSFGLKEDADLLATDIRREGRGSKFRAIGPGIELELNSRLPGKVNVYNALAASGAAHLLGVDHVAISRGIADLWVVPGRFERIDAGQDFEVLVDYAHTPDSLREALSASRGLTSGHVIVVFGCGGDRDREKRAQMGSVASEGADFVVLTSDNPRTEDPMEILRAIEKGVLARPPGDGYALVIDRADAIENALSRAKTGDVVLIAGKGHEKQQEFDGTTIPFDDRHVAEGILRKSR